MERTATNLGEPSDETLMAALQLGDDAALAGLMTRWELGVKAFLARLGVRAADIDDLAQEAFVRLYEKRAHFRRGAAFKPWLLTIAGNLGRNRLRWRFRRHEESMDALIEISGQPVDGASLAAHAWAEKTETAQAVRAAVDALPANLREAIVCVELEELSYEAAAQIMGCSIKAVETRLYRARQELRNALKGQV